jgi:hypothetical protein
LVEPVAACLPNSVLLMKLWLQRDLCARISSMIFWIRLRWTYQNST